MQLIVGSTSLGKNGIILKKTTKWQKSYIVNSDTTGRIAVALISLKNPNTLTRTIFIKLWYFPRYIILQKYNEIFHPRNLIHRKYLQNCHLRNLIHLKN